MTGITGRRAETCIGDENDRRRLHETGLHTDASIGRDTAIGRLLLATARTRTPIAVHAETGTDGGCLIIIDIPAHETDDGITTSTTPAEPDRATETGTGSTEDDTGGQAEDDAPTTEIPVITPVGTRTDFLAELRRREERIRTSKQKKDRT
ncbi:hypothetical protein [Bifidobacterium callimiconis]|uniref:Uncharacterized protein n=1 Tax=Bifidobacterium callimiconis TaxID=2306973 RepID=A0A430FEJ4_9BIFI|nr:hypothetical protein [Bifidobacterium callimiconis]RSX51273.1 hypothetical protein D2E23_1118 [Bifidobacterium callimiconis]